MFGEVLGMGPQVDGAGHRRLEGSTTGSRRWELPACSGSGHRGGYIECPASESLAL